jgi:hypothetical protein
VTTPRVASVMTLLGVGALTGPVAFTRDEKRAIDRLYGLVPERPQKRPEPPVAPVREDFADRWAYDDAVRDHKTAMEAWRRWKDSSPLMQAGADRNAFRHAEADGLRMVAWIAKYVEPGQDPVKVLVRMAIDAGWDVDPADVDWAETEEAAQ